MLLCVIRGLDWRYKSVKDDLKINADKYQDMTLEALADVCNAFVSISTTISAKTPAASGATTTPPATDQPPPSNRRPSNEQVRAGQAAVDKVCPHCIIRHPYIDCRKCLQAGYLIEHNPEKTEAKIVELNKSRNKKKSGKTPSASRAAAPPPAPPPAPVPRPLPHHLLPHPPPDSG